MVSFTVNSICFAFNSRLLLVSHNTSTLLTLLYLVTIANVMLWYFFCLLKLCDDIELNPGPKSGCNQRFSIYYWNFYSMSAHDYSKTSLLTANISTKF